MIHPCAISIELRALALAVLPITFHHASLPRIAGNFTMAPFGYLVDAPLLVSPYESPKIVRCRSAPRVDLS